MLHSLNFLRKLILLALLALLSASPAFTQGQPAGPKQKSELRLSWEGTPGVNRYRLQVSNDSQFTDLVFDRAVMGREYVIADLPNGKYYWRVAPAAAETGTYSTPRTVVIPIVTKPSNPTPTPTPNSLSNPPPAFGWSAATGNISQPLAFSLRDRWAQDVVGVNSDGMVYALDATNGVALWTARFRPDARRGEPTGNGGAAPFQPIALAAADGLQNVLVAFEGGVRAIEGATGRELWRATLPGRAASAVAGDLNGDGTMEVAIFQDNPAGMSFLDATTGRVLAQEKLDAAIIGAPAAYNLSTEGGVLFALAGGSLEERNIKGERIRSNKLDVQFTTPPLVVRTTQNTLAMIGADKGLIAVDAATLKPLWRVATEGDAPRGKLAAADLDNDGAPEVLMITKRGRTVAVSTANGKIKWYANIPNRAAEASLADLNGDGLTDVLIASDTSSVIGHDGRSGALIFGNEKGGSAAMSGAEGENPVYQTCAYINARSGSTTPLVVCNDPAGGGVRAGSVPTSK